MCDNETVMNKEDVVEEVVGNVGIEPEPLFEEQVDENAPKDESNRFQQLTVIKHTVIKLSAVHALRKTELLQSSTFIKRTALDLFHPIRYPDIAQRDARVKRIARNDFQ